MSPMIQLFGRVLGHPGSTTKLGAVPVLEGCGAVSPIRRSLTPAFFKAAAAAAPVSSAISGAAKDAIPITLSAPAINAYAGFIFPPPRLDCEKLYHHKNRVESLISWCGVVGG